MSLHELHTMVYYLSEGQQELATKIQKILNDEKLELPERIVKIRRLCRKVIADFEKMNK